MAGNVRPSCPEPQAEVRAGRVHPAREEHRLGTSGTGRLEGRQRLGGRGRDDPEGRLRVDLEQRLRVGGLRLAAERLLEARRRLASAPRLPSLQI